MATDKPRFSVTFTDDSLDKIQKYKKENNISTQSKAVARLVELALNEMEATSMGKNTPLYSSEALKLATDYDGLDSHGKRIVRLVADEEKARCQKEKSHSSKLDIKAELASYQAELELQEEVEEKLSASDGSGGTEKMA